MVSRPGLYTCFHSPSPQPLNELLPATSSGLAVGGADGGGAGVGGAAATITRRLFAHSHPFSPARVVTCRNPARCRVEMRSTVSPLLTRRIGALAVDASRRRFVL